MNTVLVVEDSPAQIQKITGCLKQKGFFVLAVSSAEEAQLRVKTQKPDLILLDVILPGKSGFELCRKLKNDPATKGIPIAICSQRNSNLDRSWGDMSGADAYLTKPIDEEILIKTVSQLIN